MEVLNEIYEKIKTYLNSNDNIDKITELIEIGDDEWNEIIAISDQDIQDYAATKVTDSNEQNSIFKAIQRIKIEKELGKKSAASEIDTSEEIVKIKQVLNNENEIDPLQIRISNQKVIVEYDFKEDSLLQKTIKNIDRWTNENVVDTVSKETGVPSERIEFIDSVTSYINFINEMDGGRGYNYVSRGQKDCTFALKPSLHRIYEDSYKKYAADYEALFRQKLLFHDATSVDMDIEELRAYGQHYGLPTNYLDFTEAHLVSLLFAIEDYHYMKNHAIVYFVDSFSFNRDIVKEERKLIDFSDTALKDSIEKRYSDQSYFIKVGNNNERIYYQRGCFLKVENQESLNKMLQEYTRIAIIDKNAKMDMLKTIFGLGMTFENIYPDKDNMVKTIRFLLENMEER